MKQNSGNGSDQHGATGLPEELTYANNCYTLTHTVELSISDLRDSIKIKVIACCKNNALKEQHNFDRRMLRMCAGFAIEQKWRISDNIGQS